MNLDLVLFIFFFKQKTEYEILTCAWSSDVCSSDRFDYDTYFSFSDLYSKFEAVVIVVESSEEISFEPKQKLD